MSATDLRPVAPDSTLTRSVPFTLRSDGAGDGRTLDGYGAVFDTPTRIDSWEGIFDEVIQRGAFAKTLQERTPIIQFDHGHHPMIGSLPIAAVQRLEEDAHGLHVVARMHEAPLFEPVREAIASGAISGMSFRFEVINDVWTEQKNGVQLRTITEVKLFEVGPVMYPAYDSTSVGVRSQIDHMLADPEMRAELLDALRTFEGAALLGTPDEAVNPDSEPLAHSGLSPAARLRALDLLIPQEG